ncbi:MAG: hypothetical protein ACKVP7_22950 [Hyphomicrobiaceae bacterium]
MSRRAPRGTIRRHLTLGLGLVLLPLALLGTWLLSPGHLLERAYAPALAHSERLWPTVASDGVELRPASLPMPHAIRKPFAVGDRMVIDSRKGGSEAIEVVAIEPLDGASLGLDGITLQLVTARPEGAPAEVTVRFLFAVDAARGDRKADHAL